MVAESRLGADILFVVIVDFFVVELEGMLDVLDWRLGPRLL